jgi:hypothetical protein
MSYSISYVESVISTPGHDVQYYDLNDKRQVVWTEYDGNDYEIYVYDGSIRQITMNALNEKHPKINNSGRIVWEVYDVRFGYMIKLDDLYDNNDPKTISQVNIDNSHPQINDNGYVVWRGDDGNDWENISL